MKVICEQETHREIPESMMIAQSDDAWHPLQDRHYIEWWYFDLMNGDGGIVRGQFAIARGISRPGKVTCGVRASYVKPDGTEIMIKEDIPFSSFKASTGVCDVELGRNSLRGDLSHYELHMEGGGKTLDLEMDSEMRGFKSRACFGDEATCMHWVVPQPRGRARGVFRTEQETLDIDGLCYRDHNWLNFHPMSVFACWDWGRVYDTEFTFIFADIVTTRRYEGASIGPLMIYDSERLVYLTSEPGKWSLRKADVEYDPDTHGDHPRTYLIEVQDEGLSLDMNLRLERAFQEIDLLADFNPLVRWLIRTFKARPTITSFYSTGSGKLSLQGREHALTCTAVHEFLKNI
jgi:hypothetical protein